jgi:hypothetical protein
METKNSPVETATGFILAFSQREMQQFILSSVIQSSYRSGIWQISNVLVKP